MHLRHRKSNLQTLSGIRIARISTDPFFVVTQLKHQIAMLGELGAQVTVVSSDEPGLEVFAKIRGIRCEVIDIPRAISLYGDLLALLRLFLFLKEMVLKLLTRLLLRPGY
jgi:hypothetical protein